MKKSLGTLAGFPRARKCVLTPSREPREHKMLSYLSISAATDEIDHPFTFELEEGDADGTEGHARFGNYLAGGLAFVRTGETIDYFLLFWR